MDEEAIKERGRALGMNPRRHTINAGVEPNARKWRVIPASLIKTGDTVVDRGLVRGAMRTKHVIGIYSGEKAMIQMFDLDEMLKVFTEVDVSYGKIDNKGIVHVTRTSMSADSIGATLCGKQGQITLVSENNVKRLCKACRVASENESEG